MIHILSILKSNVDQPIHLIKKEIESVKLRKPTSKHAAVLYSLEQDQLLQLKNKKVHRLYATLLEKNTIKNQDVANRISVYENVGWVINSDVDACMICFKKFGMFLSPHHCKACGNVVCDSCSKDRLLVYEMNDLGPLRVCSLCNYGQAEVYAIPSRRIISKESQASLNNALSEVEESYEAKMERKKKEDEEKFRLEALQRFQQQNPHLTKMNVANTIGSTSTTETKEKEKPSNSILSIVGKRKANNPITNIPVNVLSNFSDIEIERSQKLMEFGKFTLVKPTPSFVLKLKRDNGVKIFVNFLSSDSVPFKEEEVLDPNVLNEEINKKVIFLAVTSPRKYENHKTHEVSIIYDVLTHPNEVYMADIDSTGIVRQRLCNQALFVIKYSLQETANIEQYKYLRLNKNYKGTDDNDKTNEEVTIPLFPLPNKDTFYELKQFATVPIELIPPENFEYLPKNFKHPNVNDISHSITPPLTPKADTNQTAVTNQTGTKRRTSIFSGFTSDPVTLNPDTNDPTINNLLKLDTRIFCLLIDREKLDSIINQPAQTNFNKIVPLIDSHEINIKDFFLFPKSGFVIQTLRNKPMTSVFINICHHPNIGKLTSNFSLADDLNDEKEIYFNENTQTLELPLSFQYLIGNVEELNQLLSNNSRVLFIDLVISSDILFNLISSKEKIREHFAIEMIKIINGKYNLSLDTKKFSMPLIPGGYLTSKLPINVVEKVVATTRNDYSYLSTNVTIPPVSNLSDVELANNAVIFLGKFFKQGHQIRSWKERYFIISENKIIYYDLKNFSYSGDINIEDCEINSTELNECQPPPPLSSIANSNSSSFPFIIKSMTNGGEYLYCSCNIEDQRRKFIDILTFYTTESRSQKVLSNIPPMLTGYMKKKGHRRRNWKNRFFILNKGLLRYYEMNGQEGKGVAETPLGFIDLKDATVVVVINDDNGRKLENDFRLLITHYTLNYNKAQLMQFNTFGFTRATSTSNSFYSFSHSSSQSSNSSNNNSFISNFSFLSNKQHEKGAEQSLLVEVKSIEERNLWFESIRRQIEYAKTL